MLCVNEFPVKPRGALHARVEKGECRNPVYARLLDPSVLGIVLAFFLVSRYTDTPIYVFPLALALSLIIKSKFATNTGLPLPSLLSDFII